MYDKPGSTSVVKSSFGLEFARLAVPTSPCSVKKNHGMAGLLARIFQVFNSFLSNGWIVGLSELFLFAWLHESMLNI